MALIVHNGYRVQRNKAKQSKVCFKSTRVRNSHSAKKNGSTQPFDENKKFGTYFSSKVIMSLLIFKINYHKKGVFMRHFLKIKQ